MVNYWLTKQEPSGPRGYNFSTLEKEKTTVWDGVHNNLALKHMRNMKKNDLVMYYHTGDEREIVGIMTVTSKPYPTRKKIMNGLLWLMSNIKNDSKILCHWN